MKKILALMLVTWVLSFTMAYSIDKKQMEKWVTIITEKDAPTKMQKLEEFHTEYGDKNDQLTRLIYMNLTITSYQVQKFDKTIQYGEKALESKEIESSDKLKIYLSLANAYYVTKTDMGKANNYANLVIELAKSLQEVTKTPQMELQYIAPALRLQAKIIDSNGKSLKNTTEALGKALEALKIDKSESSLKLVLPLATEVNKQGQTDLALTAYESVYAVKPSAELAKAIGFMYLKKGNDAKTIEFLKASYQLQKTAKLAFDLGILYNKTQDIDNAIDYFADSFVLYEKAGNDPDGMTKAKSTLEHLYFNVKSKDVASQDEKEKGYQELMAAARTRLGIAPTTPPTAPVS